MPSTLEDRVPRFQMSITKALNNLRPRGIFISQDATIKLSFHGSEKFPRKSRTRLCKNTERLLELNARELPMPSCCVLAGRRLRKYAEGCLWEVNRRNTWPSLPQQIDSIA